MRFFEKFIPNVTPQEQARARVLVATCFATGAAILAMLFYWILFRWLEQWETVMIGLGIILFLAGMLALVKRGRIRPVAWTLTLLLLLLNLANMTSYGIGTVSSAAYLLVVVLATFTLGPWLGIGSAILGSIAAFGIALAGAAGALQTEIPFQESNLSFDAITLTLVYMMVAVMCASTVKNSEKR